MFYDEMTPKERMIAFAKGGQIDRIPMTLSLGETIAPLFGYELDKYSHSAEILVDVEIQTFKKFRLDNSNINTTLRGMAEAMGAKLEFPKDSMSVLKEEAVKDIEDIDKLEVVDPKKDGRLPVYLKAVELTMKAIGDEANVGCVIAGPLTTASLLVGTENLMRWTIKHPSKVEQIMELVAESNNRLIKELAHWGIDFTFPCPVSSASLLSKRLFNKFSFPYLKNNIQTVIELTGKKPSVHICGKSKIIWESMAEAGISGFSIDEVEDLREAKEIIGEKTAIIGNIPPVEVLKNGNKDTIYERVKESIGRTYDSPKGYILSTGCQVPMFTKEENIHSFVEAGRYYGRYPINKDLLNS